MKPPSPHIRLAGCACALAFALCAGSAAAVDTAPISPPVASAPALTADQVWAALDGMAEPRPKALPENADASARRAALQAQAMAWLEQADWLKGFYTEHPSHPQAGEARVREARALIHAARWGDDTHPQRIALLVDAVRRDSSIAAAKRCEIVGMSKYQDVQLFRLRGEAERLAAVEQIERQLIQEFPAAPHPYETLLQVARLSDDRKGNALAVELAGLADAPAPVRTGAAGLIERYALDGVALAELLPQSASEASALGGARETIVYAWSSANQVSLAFARELQEAPPPGARLIGVNLDPDPGVGRAAAQTRGLADPQIYDARGEIAARLKFDAAPLAYIARADGKIRTVSGVRELTESWAAARKAMFRPPLPTVVPSASP